MAVPPEALIGQAVAAHLPAGKGRFLAARCCADAVAFARDGGEPGAGARARRAAALLLELDCPDLPPETRHELAVACQLTVLGALARRTGTEGP